MSSHEQEQATMQDLCETTDTGKVEAWIRSQGPVGGAALLYFAACRGCAVTVQILLEKKGVVLNIKDHESGDTALHAAAKNVIGKLCNCSGREGPLLGFVIIRENQQWN